MRLRYWVLIFALLGAHFTGYSPTGAAFDLCSHSWSAWRSSRTPAIPDDSLTAAIKNVTSDYDQVTRARKLAMYTPQFAVNRRFLDK